MMMKKPFLPLKSFLVLFSLTFCPIASVMAQEEILKLHPDLIQVDKKDPIDFVPFPILDMQGVPIGENELIKVHDKFMTAKEYYSQLNDAEKKLNQIGHSLRKDPGKALQKILIDEAAMRLEGLKNEAVVSLFNPVYMQAMQTQEQMKQEVLKEVEKRKEDLIHEINQLSAKSPLAEIPINNLTLDPAMVKSARTDLKSRVSKYWNYEQGSKKTFAFSSSAHLNLGASNSEAEILAKGQSDAAVFDQNYNLVYGHVQAETSAETAKVKWDTYLKVAGLTLFQKQGESKELINLKARDFDIDFSKEIRKGWKWGFFIGPIPCSGEIGFSGKIDFDWGSYLSLLNSTVEAKATTDIGGFANVAADVGIARAGVEGELTVVEAALTLQGFNKMNLDGDEPSLQNGVRSDLEMTALKGDLGLFVEYGVPMVGTKKEKFSLIDFEGYEMGKKTLFNFTKKAKKNGYSLEGAPAAEDYEGVNLDVELNKLMGAVVTDLNQRTPGDEAALRGVLEDLDRRRQEMAVFITGLGRQ